MAAPIVPVILQRVGTVTQIFAQVCTSQKVMETQDEDYERRWAN
jgi:hypothetical protein